MARSVPTKAETLPPNQRLNILIAPANIAAKQNTKVNGNKRLFAESIPRTLAKTCTNLFCQSKFGSFKKTKKGTTLPIEIISEIPLKIEIIIRKII